MISKRHFLNRWNIEGNFYRTIICMSLCKYIWQQKHTIKVNVNGWSSIMSTFSNHYFSSQAQIVFSCIYFLWKSLIIFFLFWNYCWPKKLSIKWWDEISRIIRKNTLPKIYMFKRTFKVTKLNAENLNKGWIRNRDWLKKVIWKSNFPK